MLTFVQAVKICVFKKPFNWKNRASRSEFWWFNLFAFLVELALGILSVDPYLRHNCRFSRLLCFYCPMVALFNGKHSSFT